MSATVAILVTDAERANVTDTINALTPEYTVGFIRMVAPIIPAPTPATAPTHWYTNASSVPDEVVAAWQEIAPSLIGVVMFTAINADNPLEWAFSNLASQGLMFVPEPEI